MSHNLIRGDEVYVSWITRKGLSYCLTEDESTVDALAEKILADWIKANHPDVVEHMKKQAQAEKEFKDGRKANQKESEQ